MSKISITTYKTSRLDHCHDIFSPSLFGDTYYRFKEDVTDVFEVDSLIKICHIKNTAKPKSKAVLAASIISSNLANECEYGVQIKPDAWSSYDLLSRPDYKAYLIYDFRKVIGGFVTEHSEYTNVPKEALELRWIWLHPFFRSKQIDDKNFTYMQRIWQYLTEQAGDHGLIVQTPYSKAMRRFMDKQPRVQKEFGFLYVQHDIQHNQLTKEITIT